MTDRELMQQALEALGLIVWTNNPPVTDAIAALRERLAREEPTRAEKMREAGYTRRPSLREFPSDKPAREEQEPVAWMFEDDEDNGHKTFRQTPPSPEAVAYLAKWNRPAWAPLYTAPQRREWVGLTDEEMQDLWDRYAHMEMMRAIEAKLREKNA